MAKSVATKVSNIKATEVMAKYEYNDILVISKDENGNIISVNDFSKKYGIPVINHYNDSDIINRKDLFVDSFHMNYKGAEMYSKKIVGEINSKNIK